MRRLICILMMLSAFSLHAQKQAKPNINKALKSLQEGKLDEAKTQIDAATTYEKTMNDGKTWYYRGLIYAAIDTTSKEQYKSLDPDPLKVALESFAKADELSKNGKEAYFVTDPGSVLPVTKDQHIAQLANHYLNKGATLYQDDKLEEALAAFEKTQAIFPTDTTSYFYAGFVANSLENYDKALSNFQSYVDKGGKSPDAYSLMYNIYAGPKEDKNKALEVVKVAKEKFPTNTEFPKYEIGLLIDLDQIDQAKVGLEQAVQREPDNKIFHFYLGYVNSKQEKWEDAKKNFEAALKVDPNYFDAQYYLAQIYLIDANKIRDQMKSLGISAADKRKQAELDKVLVEKYKIALPYWEKAERLKNDDQDVLDRLRAIYYYLGDDKNEQRILAKQKQLGHEN